MIEFICLTCGKNGAKTGKGGQDQKFCSRECKAKYYRSKYGYGGEICQYNEGVGCLVRDCENCGWNPLVEKMRKELLV
jgi:hypothetical protein